jgi:hypothetical protein
MGALKHCIPILDIERHLMAIFMFKLFSQTQQTCERTWEKREG